MRAFMDENFLLQTETARQLFFDYAKEQPIFDYHCHLNPAEIQQNKRFENITEVWLGGDHYKWRAMRSHGIEEQYITGTASDREKFYAYAETMPYLIGNPLYHWSHLELQRYFGVTEQLSRETAELVYQKANEVTASADFNVHNILKNSKVRMIGTTDDPTDDLQWHAQIRENPGVEANVLPTFRPDNGVEIQKPGFVAWVQKLGEAYGKEIKTYADFLTAIQNRMDYFGKMGCCCADHGLCYVPYREAGDAELERIFAKALAGGAVTREEEEAYKTHFLVFCGQQYARRGWVMQMHLNVIRCANTRMFEKLGPDTGFDSIDDNEIAKPLAKLMDAMDRDNLLPKTILYTLNPKDQYVLATMAGNFQQSDAKSKVQLGSGWWFCDQMDGMEYQMKTLANLGVLSDFVGMLTDSRSFISYARHEYFRRILCNVIGKWVEDGLYPNDQKYLKEIIEGICYKNAETYFSL